jgi:hypothetical protein
LQNDIDKLGSWARKWGMRFQPIKCNMMKLTRKKKQVLGLTRFPVELLILHLTI